MSILNTSHWVTLSLTLILTACSNAPLIRQTGSNAISAIGHAPDCAESSAVPSIKCSATVSATFDSDGGLWIAWVDHGHLYLQSLTKDDSHFSEPVKVNAISEDIAAHGENRPKIKLDQQGRIYVTWSQKLKKRFAGHIRFARSEDGGKSFSAPVTINDNLDEIGHSFDTLEIGRNGEIFIAWLDSRDKVQAKAAQQEHAGSSLYYTWSEDGGNSFHPNQRVASHSCECCRLASAMDADNRPLILWRQVFEGGIRDHALVHFKDWATPGPVTRVSWEDWKIDACPHHGPALAVDENDTYHAAWFSGAESKAGLYYAHSEDGGLSFSAAQPFGQQGKHPAISALDDKVVLAWSEFDGELNRVWLMSSSDGGNSWTQPLVIAKAAGKADDAFLLNDGETFYLSWQTGKGYVIEALDIE